MKFQAYVINLARAVDRWEQMESRLRSAGIPYTRVDGVDGRQLQLPIAQFDAPGHQLRTGRQPILPEIGCYLSHLKAIETFLAGNQSHGLILEDDAVFSADCAEVIQQAGEHADLWDMLRLSSVNTDRTRRVLKLPSGRSLGVSLTRSKGAAAYLINRKAAKVFLKRLSPMRRAYDLAFDLEYLMGLRAMAVTPYPVQQDARLETQIQNDGSAQYKLPWYRYASVFPFRCVLETRRFVRRGILYARLRRRARSGVCFQLTARLGSQPK